MSSSHLARTLRGISVGALVLAASAVVPVSLASAHDSAHVSSSHASLWVRGVVLARNAARHTLVVSNGAQGARTLRLAGASSVNTVALGTEVRAHATPLSDGSFTAVTLARHGTSRRARLRATVVAATSGRLTLSTGASVLSVNVGARSAPDSSSTSTSVGDVVEVSVEVSNNGLSETALQDVGSTNLIELQGSLSSVTPSSIVVAVQDGASTTISVPSSLTLPSTIVSGDQVEVLVDYSNGAYSLVTITNDGAASSSSGAGVSSSEDGQQSLVHIEGIVVAANATSVTIQAGDQASPVVVAVPATLNVSALTVGADVHADASLLNGVLTLVDVQVQPSEGDQSQSTTTEVEGTVVSVSSTSLVIQPGDSATPVTLVVPSSIDVSSISPGARVHARGDIVNGVLTLSDFHLQSPEDSNSALRTQIDGTVSAVSPTSITIQPSDNSSAQTLVVPGTVNDSAIVVGNSIHATATLVSGVLTLTNFEVHESSSNTVELSGVVTAVSATSLSVLAGDNAQLVTLVVPSSVDTSTLAVGEHVDVVATGQGASLTVASVTLNS